MASANNIVRATGILDLYAGKNLCLGKQGNSEGRRNKPRKEFPQSPTNGTNDLINIETNADFLHTWPLSSFPEKFRKALHSFHLDFSYLCQCTAAGVPQN